MQLKYPPASKEPARWHPPLRLYLIGLLVLFAVLTSGAATFQRDRSLGVAEERASDAVAFRAKLAANEIEDSIAETREAVDKTAVNPGLRQLFGPEITPGCTLSFSGAGPFTSGHFDIISDTGSVRCSSRPLPSSNIYAGADWLRSARTRAKTSGPMIDVATGRKAIVVTTPIRGLGVVAAFLDLDGVAPDLSTRLSGPVKSRFALVQDVDDISNGADSDARIRATAPIASLRWSIEAWTLRTEALAEPRTMSNLLNWYLVATFVVLLIAVQLLYLKLVRPIRRLSVAIRGATPGKVPADLALSGPAEVISLGNDFTALTMAVQKELTQRREAESAQQSATAERDAHASMLDFIVKTSHALIHVKDPHGRYLLANPAVERALGKSQAEIIGQTDVALIPEHPSEYKIYDVRAEEGLQRFEAEYEVAQGRRCYDVAKFPLSGTGGRPDGICTVALDVTEQRQAIVANAMARDAALAANEAVSEARDAAVAATAAKSAFLATMSHEIRTPMNAVIGMTDLLSQTDLDPQQEEYVNTVRYSGDALMSVINDILDFSKIESGGLELEQHAFSLRDELEACLELVAGAANAKGLVLVCDVDDSCAAYVRGDALRLRQILANLLANAVKFTDVGHILVEAVCRVEDSGVCVTIKITDTGVGMSPAGLDRLFKSFSQVDASTTRVYGGTGLGLAISQRLAEAMHGSIVVSSEPGRGSTFTVTVVLDESLDEAAAGSCAHAPHPSLKQRTVLVVDDHAIRRNIRDRQLTRKGMACTTAGSAEQALCLVAKGFSYDVAVITLSQGEEAVVELARSLRQGAHASSAAPIIFLTSLGRRPGPADHLFAGFVTLPVRSGQLVDALTAALGGVCPRQETPPELVVADPAAPAAMRVLLVEDNPVNRRVGELLLYSLGQRVDTVADGDAAVAAVKRHRYDVVLMDIQMPKMDGLEATRLIRAQVPAKQQPIIVAMTASTLDSDRAACTSAGMQSYLSKPVRAHDLRALLDELAIQAGSCVTPAADLLSGSARSAHSAAESLEAVDTDILNAMVDDLDGGDDLRRELVGAYLSDSRELVSVLCAASSREDLPAVKAAAHQLRSSSALLGATTLAALLDSAEGAASATPEDIPGLSVDINVEYARVAKSLEELSIASPSQ